LELAGSRRIASAGLAAGGWRRSQHSAPATQHSAAAHRADGRLGRRKSRGRGCNMLAAIENLLLALGPRLDLRLAAGGSRVLALLLFGHPNYPITMCEWPGVAAGATRAPPGGRRAPTVANGPAGRAVSSAPPKWPSQSAT